MCSNYEAVTEFDRLKRYFGVEREIKVTTPAQVWPTSLAPFIRLSEDGLTKMAEAGHFGLLPHFAKEVAYGRRTYNARSETVHKLPSFRESWTKGWRCIVPADSVFEQNYETGKPIRWCVRTPGNAPMGIAGIYRQWHGDDRVSLWSFAMLTVNADGHDLYQRFHAPGEEKRMIVILDPNDYDRWLTCSVDEAKTFFKQWHGALEATPAPLPARVRKAR